MSFRSKTCYIISGEEKMFNNRKRKAELSYIKDLIIKFDISKEEDINFLLKLQNLALPENNGYQITELPKDIGMSKLHFVLSVISTNASKVYIDEKYAQQLKDFLFGDDNYVVGIHLPGANGNFYQKQIFSQGLENSGDLLRGVPINNEWVDINKTVSIEVNFPTFLGRIKNSATNKYKISEGSNINKLGAYIVRIPKANVGLAQDGPAPQPIYYYNERNTPTLLPEYIVGYLNFDSESIGALDVNPNYGRNSNLLATIYDANALKNVANRRTIS